MAIDGTAAVVERVLVRNDGAQRVVAAAQVEHHQAARPRALRPGDVAQERRRREADGERRHAAADEVSTRDIAIGYLRPTRTGIRTSPTISRARPAALSLQLRVGRRPCGAGIEIRDQRVVRLAGRRSPATADRGTGSIRSLGDAARRRASRPRLNRWLTASVAAKFMRASIAPVENQPAPSSQPLTSGGSNSVCPMAVSGPRAASTEKPFQPTSLIARATNSTGQE